MPRAQERLEKTPPGMEQDAHEALSPAAMALLYGVEPLDQGGRRR
jgi:hypothetical protein